MFHEQIDVMAVEPPTSAVMAAFRQIGYSEDDPAISTERAIDVRSPQRSDLERGEILVRVHASALAAGDTFLGKGGARALFDVKFPSTIGRDGSGVVEAIGAGTRTGLQVNDRVAVYVALGGGRGTFAERCVVSAKHAIRIPDTMSFADASTLPTSGCTTYQALIGRGVLSPNCGLEILILGGSSGNGLIAIQLAKAMGCSVIATTSSQVDLCKSLGATLVINHRAGDRWEELCSAMDFDVIYDCIEGLPAWRKSNRVLKRSRAKFVSIVMDDTTKNQTVGDIVTFLGRVMSRWVWSFFGYPHYIWHVNAGSTAGLAELVAMAGKGQLRPVLDGDPRPPTWEGFVDMWTKQMSGRAHGKLVMSWDTDGS